VDSALDFSDAPKIDYPFLMANPQSINRLAWDFIVIIPMLVYLAVTMPMKVSSDTASPLTKRSFIFSSRLSLIIFN